MKKQTFVNRLSLRIMVVLIIISAIVMAIIYAITKDSMAREAESRYEGIIMHANEKIRGVLSDVYVGTINNIVDIERDLDNPDKLQAHLERMVNQNMYMSSCRLIFDPDVYPQKGHRFEIYAWRDSAGIIRGRQMNEEHPDYLVHAWYQDSLRMKKATGHLLISTELPHSSSLQPIPPIFTTRRAVRWVCWEPTYRWNGSDSGISV